MLRNGATEQDIMNTVRQRWEGREDRYSELRNGNPRASKRLEMFQIGG